MLPRGFGGFAALEVLDLTYNNLSEASMPNNFWNISTLRALYVGDNDFETIPPEVSAFAGFNITDTSLLLLTNIFAVYHQVSNLKELQILSFRENDVISIPKEIGTLNRLRELHLQGKSLFSLLYSCA